MMIYKLSGDVDELLGRPVGEVATVESVGDSIGVDPMNVIPIAEAFDESVTVEELPIPWEQIDEVGEVVSESDSEVVSSPEEAVIESSFCEMLPLLDPIPVGDTTTEAAPADDTSPTTPAGPTNEQVIARKLQLCDLIQHVGDEIQAVDEEIAELSSELKAAKKLRESKLERLQELSQELKNARRDLAEKQGAAVTESEASDESDDDSDDDSDDELSTREEGDDSAADDSATDFDPDAYNPWDHWEQGRAITCVRLLVATEGMVAGTSCSVFDVEPPQVEGDSLSGSVTVFRLGSDRETVVLSKRECAPMIAGVKEPPIGHRIGVRVKKKESAAKQNQPEDDSWKSVPVSDLDLPSSLVSILVEDNSIRTIGDIQEFARWKRLTDLKKVGQAKAEKIEEALVEFWKKR